MTLVSLDMAYRSFLEVLAGYHPPRYAASLKPSSPRFTHSSRRSRGWRMPPGGVSVARPTRWGNPYLVEEYGLGEALRLFREHAGTLRPGTAARAPAGL